jgi:hypothetical protein
VPRPARRGRRATSRWPMCCAGRRAEPGMVATPSRREGAPPRTSRPPGGTQRNVAQRCLRLARP